MITAAHKTITKEPMKQLKVKKYNCRNFINVFSRRENRFRRREKCLELK